MKSKLILSLSILFLSIFAFAQNECSDFLNSGGASTVSSAAGFKEADKIGVQLNRNILDPIRLKPGDQVWGYYECSNCNINDEYTEVSAMPGHRRCTTCGMSYTDEPLDKIPPAVFRKDGALYLVNPGQLSTNEGMAELARTGVANKCPFCGTRDFKLELGCRNCGAKTEQNVANDVREYALRKSLAALKGSTRFSSTDAAMAEGRGLPALDLNDVIVKTSSDPKGPTVTELETELEVLQAKKEERRPKVAQADVASEPVLTKKQRFIQRLATRRGALILAASTLIATTPIGYTWGTTSYTRMAEVVSVSQTSVQVEYYNQGGHSNQMVLKRNQSPNEATWHIGEQIELYFVKWKLGKPSGGERGNGDVLTPR